MGDPTPLDGVDVEIVLTPQKCLVHLERFQMGNEEARRKMKDHVSLEGRRKRRKERGRRRTLVAAGRFDGLLDAIALQRGDERRCSSGSVRFERSEHPGDPEGRLRCRTRLQWTKERAQQQAELARALFDEKSGRFKAKTVPEGEAGRNV